jgi:hypothetical protein
MLRLRRTQREGIAGELRDHLVEHVAHLEASGIAHEEAVRRALEEFGDAAALAANFQALVGMRRRRLVMRCTIGTTVVMTGLVVAMLAFRPPVIDDPSIAQAQAGGSDSKAAKGKAQGRSEHRLASDDGGARQRLQINKIDAEFSDLPVRDALAYLSDRIGVQFHIDKQSLENASTNSDTPVTLRLQNVPAEMVLDLILRQAKLGYRLRNGVILVASAEDVQSQTEVRVYELPVGGYEDGVGLAEELAALIPATVEVNHWSEHPVVVAPNGSRQAGYGSMSAPGGVGIGGYGAAGGYGSVGGSGELIESVGGGGVGTIRVFRGTLVISQTPEVHQKIEKLLADLSTAGALNPQRLEDLRAAKPDLGGYGGPTGSPHQGHPGYGQTGQQGHGQTGYGATGGGYGGTGYGGTGYGQTGGPTGRGGYGATGGSRGGYGSTSGRGGYGATGRAGADRPGYGRTPASSPAAEGAPGQTPTGGGSAPAGSSGSSPDASTTPGGPPSGATDPNAAGSGPASGTGLFAPEHGTPNGSAPPSGSGESGSSSASPPGAYGGAR